VRTRIGRRGCASIVCQGASPQGMPSVFCPRMVPLPNTFGHDGICGRPPSTAKRCKTASRVGPKLLVQSGSPKRRVGEHRTQNESSAIR
jgi:hypothetical protein